MMAESNIRRAVIESIEIRQTWDQDADTSYLEQDEFADRLEAFRAGEFGFVGIQAVAKLRVPTAQGGWIAVSEVTSPGLWSIESDSGEDYFRTVAAEEIDQLKDILCDGLGFEVSEVAAAVPAEFIS